MIDCKQKEKKLKLILHSIIFKQNIINTIQLCIWYFWRFLMQFILSTLQFHIYYIKQH